MDQLTPPATARNPARRKLVFASVASAALAAVRHGDACAQSLPTARILVGFPPGGTSDALARRVAEQLRGKYAGNVIVENRPGGAGQVAVAALKSSAADGSVLLLTPASMLVVYPHTYQDLTMREWFGFFLPGAAKAQAIERAFTAFRQALSAKELVDTLSPLALEVQASDSPEAFAATLRAEHALWAKFVKRTGFTAQS